MAPVLLSFMTSLRSNHGVITRIRKRVLQNDARRLHEGCTTRYRPGTRRWQSTWATKPQSSVLRVEEVTVQSSQVTVVESNKKILENISEPHPSTTATTSLTEPNVEVYSQHSVPLPQDTADYQNLLELRDEALSEKIRKMLLAQSESTLNSKNKLRWTSNMSHTYDSNFLLSDNAFDSLLLSEGGIENILNTEKLDFQESVYLQTHSQFLPSKIHGTIKAKPIDPLEQNILEPAGSPENIPKKEKSTKDSKKKTKVVSTKKNKQFTVKTDTSDAVNGKKQKKQRTVKADTEKGKKKKATTKKIKNTARLTQEELVLQAEPYLETVPEVELPVPLPQEPAPKREKVKGKKKKRQEESERLKALRRKGREISFNQSLAAYISVCMSLGMLNRATHTLLYYRQLAQHTTRKNFSQVVSSVLPYNIVLRGLAEKGNYNKMVEVMKCLKADNISASETTFACLLECLGRQSESPANTTEINTWLTVVEEQGIDLDNVLCKVDHIKNGLEFAIKAIHRAHPSFFFSPKTLPFDYENNLVEKLNQTLHSTKVSSPAFGTVTSEQLAAWAKEQLEMEAKGDVVVKSIEAPNESEDTQKYRKLVESYEQQWRSVLLETFNRSLGGMKRKFFSNQLDKRMTVYPYLIALKPEEFVNIMIQEVQGMARGSLGHSMTKHMMYRHLGDLVFSRYLMHYKEQSGFLNKLQEVYADYISWYMDSDRPEGVTYVPRVRWQELSGNSLSETCMDHYPIEWPSPVLVSVGKFLYSLMVSKIMVWNPLHSQTRHKQPAIYEVEASKEYRVVDEIKPSPNLIELYQKAALPTLTFQTTKTPMVCPPVPWVSTKLGGYLLNDTKIVRLPYNAQQQQKRMEECGVQQLYPTMDSLNQLSTIPWKVNQPMLDLIIHLFNSKGCEELDIPPPPTECPQPEKIHSGMSKADMHKIKRQQLEFDQKKNEMFSLWCDMLYKLSIAHHYRDRVFWFPHNMDFRGRVYPTPPHLNHLSSDSVRSILQFARGEKLGPEGLKWLKLHLINLTGLVKREPISARLDYCESNLEDILDSADNPLDGRRWWTKSDEPWQTLAACKELAAALRSGNPEEYVSHLPIHQDGSCNGLQHYAALGRDEIGAKSVNLAPCPAPQDVYSDVAALVEKEREADAKAGNELAQVLEGYIKRKIIKQTVMTTVYGVTRFGARLQIDKQLKALDDFPQNQRWAASHYLVQKTFICLEKMFTATKEIQNWFTDCAKIISETRGQNLEYVTPLGLPVVQPYSNLKYRYAMDNASFSMLPATYSIDSYMKPNVMKQKNAFPPNFIHSLDSSHMMLTSLHCQRSDITFVSVHDCFWTHACSVNIMNKVCREQFVALHQEQILEDLSRFLEEKFTLSPSEFDHDGSALDASRMKLNSIISNVPPKGQFEIASVHDSVYFFS